MPCSTVARKELFDRCNLSPCLTSTIGPRRHTPSERRASPYPQQKQYRSTRGTFFEVTLATDVPERSKSVASSDDDTSHAFFDQAETPSPMQRRLSRGSASWSSISSTSRSSSTDQFTPSGTEDARSLIGELIAIDSYACTTGSKNDYWVCYTCTRRLPPEDFKSEQSFQVRCGDHPSSPMIFLRRFCIPCGIRIGAHKPGPVFETKHPDKRRWICACYRIHDSVANQCRSCHRLSTLSVRAGEYTIQVSIPARTR